MFVTLNCFNVTLNCSINVCYLEWLKDEDVCLIRCSREEYFVNINGIDKLTFLFMCTYQDGSQRKQNKKCGQVPTVLMSIRGQ
jgi:hypothetical protein